MYLAYSCELRAEAPLDTYRAQALRIEPGFYTSFELKRLNGTEVAFDHFGSEYETVFAGNPEALAEAKVFRDMRIASTVLSIAGLSLLLSELVLILAGHDSVVDNNKTGAQGLKPLTFTLLGSGLALNVAGILVEVSSLGVLDRAVQRYNRQLLPKDHPGAKVQLRVGF
jgi:hypothetical protein